MIKSGLTPRLICWNDAFPASVKRNIPSLLRAN